MNFDWDQIDKYQVLWCRPCRHVDDVKLIYISIYLRKEAQVAHITSCSDLFHLFFLVSYSHSPIWCGPTTTLLDFSSGLHSMNHSTCLPHSIGPTKKINKVGYNWLLWCTIDHLLCNISMKTFKLGFYRVANFGGDDYGEG